MTNEPLTAAVIALSLAQPGDTVTLGEAGLISATRPPGPIRLSTEFLRRWCGNDYPTPELQAQLRTAGIDCRQIMDFQGGWEITPVGEFGGLFD
jgi:hypothetical protein